jgi:UDPglucose 6-dehydrogenase
MSMNVTVIGTGYVGLTTGVALAFLGNRVTCVDVDREKLARLQRGETPIHEPHLPELQALAAPNLHYTDDYREAIPSADVIFIAVGTPPLPDGNPDLQYLQAAAKSIGQNLGDHAVVVINKSTLPIGSGNWVDAMIRDVPGCRNKPVYVASNPEFLREGSALRDALYPDRIVVGTEDPRALRILENLYQPLVDQQFDSPAFLPRPAGMGPVPFVATDLASAELIKYAANAFLSVKISFINEIAALSEKVGADVSQIARGIGLDARIGSRFLQAGIGWGGSCFGKDTSALMATARDYRLDMPIVKAAKEINDLQRERVVEKLLDDLKILKGKTVGLLGIAFKPDTDDIRDAPAMVIARRLKERGARVLLHDPVAMPNARRMDPDLGQYQERARDVFEGADAVVLVTEWSEYRDLPFEDLLPRMRRPILLDGRNFLPAERLIKVGYRYLGMGRSF